MPGTYISPAETGFYATGTRYYDPEIGRFINADGQLNDDILGGNLFAYCGNNPVVRTDDTGEGWWIPACMLVGAVAGAVTKIVSNKISGNKWYEGVAGAALGGAVFGGIIATTGSVVAAGFASAAVEATTNEVISYTTVAKYNGSTRKKVTEKNIINSVSNVAVDTALGGTASAVTGKMAGTIVPTNNGWFKPQKFVSSFAGKYAIKSELQTLVQSGLLTCVEVGKKLFNFAQEEIVTIFP